MKKNDQDTSLSNRDITQNKDFELDKIKTTNVNILLNRVRLDKKKTLRKRIIFSMLIVSIISSLIVFFIT